MRNGDSPSVVSNAEKPSPRPPGPANRSTTGIVGDGARLILGAQPASPLAGSRLECCAIPDGRWRQTRRTFVSALWLLPSGIADQVVKSDPVERDANQVVT